MPMNRKTLIAPSIAGLLIVATLISAGCLTEDEKPFSGTVRVGWLTGDLHHLPYFVAKDTTILGGGKSMFSKQGLNVTDAQAGGFSAGPAEMDKFKDGGIDMGLLGAPPAIQKHVLVNINTTVVGVVNEIGSALVVRSSINTVQDLRGKTVLTPSPGSIQHYLLLKYLKDNGLNTSDLVIESPVAGNLMVERLNAGTADGFISWEPFCEDAVVKGYGKVLVYSKDIYPDHLCCVVVADSKFAKENKDVVVHYLKAHVEAIQWINQAMADNMSADYAKLVSIAVGFTGRTEQTIKAALANMKYDWAITSTIEAFFTSFTQGLMDNGVIKQSDLQARGYSTPADLTAKYIDDSYIKEATKL